MAIDKVVDSTALDLQFTAIAEAIRTKSGEDGAMTIDEMPSRILELECTGVGNEVGTGALSSIEVKSYTHDFIESPAEGYYGIGQVIVRGDKNLIGKNIRYGVSILGVDGEYVPPTPTLYVGSKEIAQNGSYELYPTSGYSGFSKVNIDVDVPTEIVSQSKSVIPSQDAQIVTPDDGYTCLSSVSVSGSSNLKPEYIRDGITIFDVTGSYNPGQYEERTVTPGTNNISVVPGTEYDGLSKVIVLGDSNLIASNIREGTSIFGVDGSYSSGTVYQDKTVTPRAKSSKIICDSGYNALASVTVSGDSNLSSGNIADGVTIFGVTGSYVSPMSPLRVVPSTSEQYITPADGYEGFSSVTVAAVELSTISEFPVLNVPDEYLEYVRYARTNLYTEDYSDLVVWDYDDWIAVSFLMDDFAIQTYDLYTTELTATGWHTCGYTKSTGVWTYSDFSAEISTGGNYAKNIVFASCLITFGEQTLFPVGVSGNVKVDDVIFDNEAGTCTLTFATGQTETLTFGYDESGNVISVTDSSGHVTTLEGMS